MEYVAAEKIGQETVTYVSNIYKYYIAYRLILESQACHEGSRREDQGWHQVGSSRRDGRAAGDAGQRARAPTRSDGEATTAVTMSQSIGRTNASEPGTHMITPAMDWSSRAVMFHCRGRVS